MRWYCTALTKYFQLYLHMHECIIHLYFQAHRHFGIIPQFSASLLSQEEYVSVSIFQLWHAMLQILYQRNQAYDPRIQLVVLDYSHHHRRDLAKNKDGGTICHHKYQKSSKNGMQLLLYNQRNIPLYWKPYMKRGIYHHTQLKANHKYLIFVHLSYSLQIPDTLSSKQIIIVLINV